jgi:Putative adhesin
VAVFYRTQTIEHPIGESGRLSIKVTSSDCVLRGVSSGIARITANFQIRASSDEEADRFFAEAQLVVDQGDGYLRISEPDGHTSLGNHFVRRIISGRGVDYDITAEIPERAELSFAGVSADINVEGLLGDQQYATVSGDLSLTGLGGSARVNSVSGDVTMRADQPISVTADTVSGDLSVVAPVIGGLRANAVSGDVDLEGQLAMGEEFRIDTVSGDLGIALLGGATFEVRGISSDVSSDLDHRIEGRQDRRRVIVGAGGPEVVFNSMSGDLAIHRPRRLDRIPAPPPPPAPPATPAPPKPSEEEQLAILQALERGEISVEEATRRLSGASNGSSTSE